MALSDRAGSGRRCRLMELASTFAVPVAMTDDGRLVLPDRAERGERYRCPGCTAEVLLRRGKRRRAHFAHRGGDGCSSESALHRAAKRLVLQVISEWKGAAGPRPSIARSCPRYSCDGGITQDLPDDITHAAEEVRLPDGSVADVVLFRGDRPAAALEILVTHRVGEEKAHRISVPWVEMKAEDLFERPYWWVAVQDGLRPFACPTCARRDDETAEEVTAIQAKAITLANALDFPLPPCPPYKYVTHECWRCHMSMVAFLWPGCGNHSTRQPPHPVPPTIQLRFTEAWGGEYWANCCPRCSAVQGDHFLRTDNWDYMVVKTSSAGLADIGF